MRRGVEVTEVPTEMPVFPAAQVPLSQGLHAATLLRGRAAGKLGKCSSAPKSASSERPGFRNSLGHRFISLFCPKTEGRARCAQADRRCAPQARRTKTKSREREATKCLSTLMVQLPDTRR